MSAILVLESERWRSRRLLHRYREPPVCRMSAASFRTVRASKSVDRPKSSRNAFLILLNRRTAIREWPPRSKKSSSKPTFSTPKSSCHHSARTLSAPPSVLVTDFAAELLLTPPACPTAHQRITMIVEGIAEERIRSKALTPSVEEIPCSTVISADSLYFTVVRGRSRGTGRPGSAAMRRKENSSISANTRPSGSRSVKSKVTISRCAVFS